MAHPFTPEQEARLREIVREELAVVVSATELIGFFRNTKLLAEVKGLRADIARMAEGGAALNTAADEGLTDFRPLAGFDPQAVGVPGPAPGPDYILFKPVGGGPSRWIRSANGQSPPQDQGREDA